MACNGYAGLFFLLIFLLKETCGQSACASDCANRVLNLEVLLRAERAKISLFERQLSDIQAGVIFEKQQRIRLENMAEEIKEALSKNRKGLIQQKTFSGFHAKDCWDLKTVYNISEDGVYEVLALDGQKRNIRCDMKTDGGGWTVFQRRGNGSVDFNQDYEAYRSGFGNLNGEFWMGNDFLYEFTQETGQTLRVDICNWNHDTRWAKYTQFSVGPPQSKFVVGVPMKKKYRLLLHHFSGTAGDALIKGRTPFDTSVRYHNESPFTTKDVDNDGYSGNCGALYSSGWWFNSCFSANLNGVYHPQTSSRKKWQGIQWITWIDDYSFKGTEMKIRPSAAATPSIHEPFRCPVI